MAAHQPPGGQGKKAFNNHGTCYDVQVAAFARYCGSDAIVSTVLEESFPRRVQGQFRADGGQPYEQMRTKAWDYSVMNLTAFFALARIGAETGRDLWRFEGKDGRGIRKTLDYLLPYATGEKTWPHGQITGWHPESLYPLLMEAAIVYNEPNYAQKAAALPGVGDALRFKSDHMLNRD